LSEKLPGPEKLDDWFMKEFIDGNGIFLSVCIKQQHYNQIVY
jgi:hypothetical protein